MEVMGKQSSPSVSLRDGVMGAGPFFREFIFRIVERAPFERETATANTTRQIFACAG